MATGRAVRTILNAFHDHHTLSAPELTERWKAARRVAIVSLSGIGDAIMSVPLAAALRHRRPDVEIAFCTPAPLAPLIRELSIADMVIPGDGRRGARMFRSLPALRRFRPDVVFYTIPFNTVRHSVYAAMCGRGVRLKTARDYSGEEWRDFRFLYSRLCPDDLHRHEVEINIDLLRALGEKIPDKQFRPMLSVPVAAAGAAASLLPARHGVATLAIHPGGMWESKQWGAERFARAVSLVARMADRPTRFVMLGAGGDLPFCRSIVERTPELEWIDCSGGSSLVETAGILERCDLLLSNDTGIMHLSAALGTPAVAVFGPTDPARVGPYDSVSRPISRPSIDEVTPQEVAAVIVEMLADVRVDGLGSPSRHSSNRSI